jgi:hypothetical protein
MLPLHQMRITDRNVTALTDSQVLPGFFFSARRSNRASRDQWTIHSVAVAGFAIEIGDRKIAAFACHICADGLIGIAMRAGNCPSTLAGNLAVVLLQKQPGPLFYTIQDCGTI